MSLTHFKTCFRDPPITIPSPAPKSWIATGCSFVKHSTQAVQNAKFMPSQHVRLLWIPLRATIRDQEFKTHCWNSKILRPTNNWVLSYSASILTYLDNRDLSTQSTASLRYQHLREEERSILLHGTEKASKQNFHTSRSLRHSDLNLRHCHCISVKTSLPSTAPKWS